MQNGSRYIIATGVSSLGLSLLYFLSLVLRVPFFITVPAVFVSVLVIFRWVLKKDVIDEKKPVEKKEQYPFLASVILVAGVYLIVKGFFPVAEKYGGWDAWGIWNLHAKYLADPANWKKMFENALYAHADYPLYVPAVNGFFIRLFSEKYLMVIPFIFHFSITLFIPVLIYLEILEKNIVVAATVFFLFAIDTFYLTKGATQYADTALAFFFLCAFVCINHADEGKGRKYITLAAACLGCCIWTKNEGSILALIFILGYPNSFFSKNNIKAFAMGLGAPLLVFLIFKMFYATDGAIISSHKGAFSQLFVASRYQVIYKYFIENLNAKFYYVKVCFFIYLLICLLEMKGPDKQFFLLLCCMGAYALVYVLSPGGGGVEWLLGTSQERLMHQLMPALMYVLSQRFAHVQFSLPRKNEVLLSKKKAF